MYKQAIAYIVDHVPVERLQAIVPLPTSRQRYLSANEPVHPTRDDFVTAVRHRDYVMEAHKDYKNGFMHLAKLTQELGLNLRNVLATHPVSTRSLRRDRSKNSFGMRETFRALPRYLQRSPCVGHRIASSLPRSRIKP